MPIFANTEPKMPDRGNIPLAEQKAQQQVAGGNDVWRT